MTDPTTPRRPCAGSAGKKRVCWARPGSDWCANHDPEKAEERRANGGKRKPQPEEAQPARPLPPGWRPEWREPRPPRGQELPADRVARAQEILESPVPPAAELREEVLRVLRSMALDPACAEASRVGAARLLLEHAAKPSPGAGAVPSTPSEAAPPWMQPRTN